MIVVAGHWEIGYNTPMIEAHQWEFPVKEWKVDEWAMCPVSGIKLARQKLELKEFQDYEEIIDAYPDLTRVFLEPKTRHQNPDTVWLDDFKHPEDCIYIFGSAHYNPTLKHKREQDTVVTIKTSIDSGGLWASQCMCLVLDDRRRK